MGTAEEGTLPGGPARFGVVATLLVSIGVEVGWPVEELGVGVGDDGDREAGPTSEGDAPVVEDGID